MKILMGAVIVLSMAAVTACGKKPEVVEEKNVESVHEEPEMADEQMTGSEHEETTESVDEEIAENSLFIAFDNPMILDSLIPLFEKF